jgi:hypothetical protein
MLASTHGKGGEEMSKKVDYSKPENILAPMKAIRVHCLDCVCDNRAEVDKCIVHGCTLWPYRFGKNPSRAGVGGGGAKSRAKVAGE